jgi:glycine betaine/proline transport system permease protein
VAICLVIGIPLGVWLGRSPRAAAAVTPLLDVMQTLPSFVYLAPMALLFGIGAPAAVIATLIYAAPPVVRITAHAIRTVSPTTLEATTSMGSSRGQLLRKVQLPMAKRTIIVGVNQTMMAALSMATIAAFIDGPGLGQPVIQALQSLDVGTAFAAGLAIVIMAIVLDRVTTAASERADDSATGSGNVRRRWLTLALLAVGVGVSIYVSRTYLWAAAFPESPNLGLPLAQWTGSVSDYITNHYFDITHGIADFGSYNLINPLQSLLANSPWYLVSLVLVAFSAIVAGWRSVATTLICIAIILATGLWNDSMVTLATTLVATAITMLLAVILGVWMARSGRVDAVLRPLLDAAQTIPPFVYLVPALGLFLTTRFTAIVAAVVYASPVAIKIVTDGIRGVSNTTVEAAESSGSSPWQIITKVQLPMARSAIALAANQGMLYVFSMVVIGGLVGAGGLGYLVVAGFSQGELFGKGLAAGIAIVALAVMLDRMAQRSQARIAPQTTRS